MSEVPTAVLKRRVRGARWAKRNKAKIRAKRALYVERHPEKVKATNAKCYRQNTAHYKMLVEKSRLKLEYGITLEDRDKMIAAQGNKCAVCETSFTKTPCIDHDHTTGAIRGLLCRHCNLMLGYAKDNPGTLRKAIAYLATGGFNE